MRTLDDRLTAALDLIPAVLEPGQRFPNFYDIKGRITHLERQHFILTLQAWMQDNAAWLSIEGLTLQSSRSDHTFNSSALTFYESREEERMHQARLNPERMPQVDRLIDLLDHHCTGANREFVQYTVDDLNHVRWNPLSLREILAFKLADTVPDPVGWLRRHTAARHAEALAASTTQASAPTKRPRL